MGSISVIDAGAAGPGRLKRITATVNTTLTIPLPTGAWGSVRIINRTTAVLLSYAINEAPAVAPASAPPIVGDWKNGNDIDGAGDSGVISLAGATSIQLLSSASADVVLNLTA